jgi:hypothetical protein
LSEDAPPLTGASTVTKPAVAADSRALYVAAQSGVLALKRDSSGRFAYDSCLVLVGPCGQGENNEGADVSELVLGPAKEKTPYNKPFALGALADAEQTFTLSPDGRSAYILDQVRASDFVRLIVLARTR